MGGRQAFGLGMLENSLEHFLELLNSFAEDKKPSIQADREQTYLKEFLFVVKNWMEKSGGDKLRRKSLGLKIPSVGSAIQVLTYGDAPVTQTAVSSPPPPPLASGASGLAESAQNETAAPMPWEQ